MARSGFLDSLGIKPVFLKNLHAKCYLNEAEALLTSMNLYKFSQENNDEMGILVSREDDEELYEQIHRQAMRWIAGSNTDEVTEVADSGDAEERRRPQHPRPKPTASGAVPVNGFCIRCKITIPANPSRPYCNGCYASWNRFKNKAYEEKYCHVCGTEHKTTLLKPVVPLLLQEVQGRLGVPSQLASGRLRRTFVVGAATAIQKTEARG